MSKNIVIHSLVYNGIDSVELPLSDQTGTAVFHDISDATATQNDILETKTAYGLNGEIVGAMPNIGSLDGTITSVSDSRDIPAGYTTGGRVGLSVSDQAKIVPTNIRSGVNILGVDGSSYVVNTYSEDAASAQDISRNKVAFVNGSRVVGQMPDNDDIYTIIADAYDDTQTYSVGDYCIYDYELYKCIQDISSSETFDPTHWEVVTVMSEVPSGGTASAVTGIKGDEELTYRTGDVNLTRDNIGVSRITNSDIEAVMSNLT